MSIKGCPTIAFCLSVPPKKLDEIDQWVCSHETFMRETHVNGDEGDGSVKPRLREYYWAKGPEMKNSMNPEEGVSGNTLFVMTEVYVADNDVAKHMEVATSWSGMTKLAEYVAEFGTYISVGTNVVCTTMTDEATTVSPALGNPSLHAVLCVPAEDLAEVETWIVDHEKFLRRTHELTNSDDHDDKGPRLTSYYFSKGPEMKNPMDPTEGTTGNTLVVLSETYVAAADITKHMSMNDEWPEGYALLGQYLGKFCKHIHVGTPAVYKTMA